MLTPTPPAVSGIDSRQERQIVHPEEIASSILAGSRGKVLGVPSADRLEARRLGRRLGVHAVDTPRQFDAWRNPKKVCMLVRMFGPPNAGVRTVWLPQEPRENPRDSTVFVKPRGSQAGV